MVAATEVCPKILSSGIPSGSITSNQHRQERRHINEQLTRQKRRARSQQRVHDYREWPGESRDEKGNVVRRNRCFSQPSEWPKHYKPEGTLVEGDDVKIKDGMIFNVTATDKS